METTATTAAAGRRSPAAFFALVVVLAAPLWVVGGASLGLPVNLPVSGLMAVVPLVAAVLLLARDKGPAAVRRLLADALDPRRIRPRICYLPILGLVPAITVAAAALGWAFGAATTLPDPSFLVTTMPGLAALFLLAAVGEEVGWAGYAQGPLQQRWGATRAGLVVGAVWATVHLVGWSLQTGHTATWTAGMWVFTVSFRLLIVRLVDRSGGSVVAAVLVHTTSNLCSLPFPALYRPEIVAPVTVAVVLAVEVWRRRGRPRAGVSTWDVTRQLGT